MFLPLITCNLSHYLDPVRMTVRTALFVLVSHQLIPITLQFWTGHLHTAHLSSILTSTNLAVSLISHLVSVLGWTWSIALVQESDLYCVRLFDTLRRYYRSRARSLWFCNTWFFSRKILTPKTMSRGVLARISFSSLQLRTRSVKGVLLFYLFYWTFLFNFYLNRTDEE